MVRRGQIGFAMGEMGLLDDIVAVGWLITVVSDVPGGWYRELDCCSAGYA